MEAGATTVGCAGAVWRERMSHCEEVVLVLTLATSRRTSVKSILKGEQQIKLRNKDKKKNHLSSLDSKFLFNHFSHFALPPTQLHGSSHNFIQQVAVSFNKTLLYYQNKTKMSKMMKFFQPKKKQTNTAWCVFHILPPCHFVCTSQLGRTWLMPVGSVTIATTQFFFFSPRQSSAACFLQ